MPQYLMLAFSQPLEGRDEEYNDWYDNVAMPVYKSLPGTTCLGRFKSLPHKGYEFEMDLEFGYVSVYLHETDDFDRHFSQIMEVLKKATAEGNYHFSDTIDKTHFFEPLFVKLGD
ncbi:hypothetical protein [Streptomyces sp. NPDC057636]|uniref:hypothetical protein n=1 Tax=Streptomyces sp. NPDC057636 TaxID=3346189 RepID=UPI0036CC80C7